MQEAGDGLPEPLRDKELKINDIDFQERYAARNDIAGQFGHYRCWQCPSFTAHYETIHRKFKLQRGIARVRRFPRRVRRKQRRVHALLHNRVRRVSPASTVVRRHATESCRCGTQCQTSRFT